MAKNSLVQLGEFGQSIWLDYISRSLIKQGRLKELLELGIRGITSNPTIFDQAISASSDYDEQIMQLHKSGRSPMEIYDELTVRDIQDACDIFMPVYEKTQKLDGYVSLEINPQLAYATEPTLAEGRRLYEKVNRPNVMLKVPATKPGFAAVEELTACGINVNVTLIFSLAQYKNAARAYVRGLKRRAENNGCLVNLHSVASVFVSRIDTAVDKLLEEEIAREKDATKRLSLSALQGKAAVANSQLIYGEFRHIFSDAEFQQLKDKGANLQRVLWASTSTKNPAYSDIKYVSELIGKDTVNTVPQNTLEAFLDHGRIKQALSGDTEEGQKIVAALAEVGVEINNVCAQLLKEGVEAFKQSFASILHSIEEKTKQLCQA